MLSDDPFVPNLGQFEVNIAGGVESRDKTVVTAPIVDLNYGLIKNVQITFATGYINSTTQNDWDAFELAFKWNFYSDDVFAMAINPKYLVYPTNSIFNEGDVYEVSFPMNINLNATLNLVLSPAYIAPINDNNHFEFGSYLQYTKENHSLYTEIFVEEAKEFATIFTLVNFGYLWQFHPHIAFMLSLGKEIKSSEKEAFISYSGLQFIY